METTGLRLGWASQDRTLPDQLDQSAKTKLCYSSKQPTRLSGLRRKKVFLSHLHKTCCGYGCLSGNFPNCKLASIFWHLHMNLSAHDLHTEREETWRADDSLSSGNDFYSHFIGQSKSHRENQVRKRKGQDELIFFYGESEVGVLCLYSLTIVCFGGAS